MNSNSKTRLGPAAIDDKDFAIIEALQENARTSLSELGRKIGLSQPAMSERVKRLEERGIIRGYGARIDLAAVGLSTMAILRLKTTHEFRRACLKQFEELPFVIEVHRVTGDDCFVLKAIVPAPEQLAMIVDAIGRFGAVTTSVVIGSEPVKNIGRDLFTATAAPRRNGRRGTASAL